MAGDREKALAAGMNDYIAKPVDFADLCEVLAKWITPASPTEVAALSSAAAEQPDDASVDELPGLDLERGVAMARGKMSIYRRLILRFRETYGDFEPLFRSAQQSSDTEAPTRCAHSLKGAAGIICAPGVVEAAAALEACCKHGGSGEETEERLAVVLSQLAPACDSIDRLDAPDTMDRGVSEALLPDGAEVERLLGRLRASLRDSDTSASEFVEMLRPVLAGPPAGELFARLDREVQRYDFDQAAATLSELENLLPGATGSPREEG
jgi:HPt (histidine-containing phosphotransfer) domain-containing protein